MSKRKDPTPGVQARSAERNGSSGPAGSGGGRNVHIRERLAWLHLFTFAVSVAGMGLAISEIVRHWTGLITRLAERPGVEFWELVVFVIVGQLMPIRIARGDEQEELATSATFAFAILMRWGTAAATLALVLASLFADVRSRKRPGKIVFRMAQYGLALGVSGFILSSWQGIGARTGTSGGAKGLLIFAAAAGAFFVVSNFLIGTSLALEHRYRVVEYLRRDLPFQLTSTGFLLALAPLVTAVAEFRPVLLPLLLLPVFAVYRSGKAAVASEHQALHDALTGLPNRTLLLDRIEQAMLSADRAGTGMAVMLLDLDRFKDVNDTLGHAAGDELLKQVAFRLAARMRGIDTVARLGGDEFAVVVRDVDGTDVIRDVSKKALATVAERVSLPGMTFGIEASVGVAVYPSDAKDAASLLKLADVAMYQAKEAHAGVQFYQREQDRNDRRRLSLSSDLRHAIDENQLVVFYQPQIGTETGLVCGAEALVRWRHPKHGMISPGEFLPLAESSGLIRSLTHFVLSESLAQWSAWRDLGFDITISVNASSWNLIDPAFVGQVEELVRRFDLPPKRLKLEITESVLIADAGRAITVLGELRALGVSVSLDDFGTGFSSLSYLKRMPIDELKIDQGFVSHMLSDRGDHVMVRSIIDLGHNLDMEVLAEGVEDDETLSELSGLGCEYAQGYLVSVPLAASAMSGWLRRSEFVQGVPTRRPPPPPADRDGVDGSRDGSATAEPRPSRSIAGS